MYSFVEQVYGEFLQDRFANPDGERYKPDGTGSDLQWIGDNYASYTGVELKTNADTADNEAIIRFLDELNNGSDYEEVMDVDAILRYLAVSTALSNLDSYQGGLAHNYYVYEDYNRFYVVPWDLNEAFGTFGMGCSTDEVIGLYVDEPTSGALADRPLIEKLLQNPAYLTTYHGYLEDLINGGLDPTALEQTINSTADLIRTAVYADPTSFYSSSEFEAGLSSAVGQTPGLLSFGTARVTDMVSQLDGTLPSSGDGSGSCSGGGGGPP